MSFGVGYMRTAEDWMLMQIFATKDEADADLPKWGNPIAPNHLFSVRELTENEEGNARQNGCPSYPQNKCPHCHGSGMIRNDQSAQGWDDCIWCDQENENLHR